MAVDAIASAVGGEPVEFGGHCDVVDVCVSMCVRLCVCEAAGMVLSLVDSTKRAVPRRFCPRVKVVSVD